MKNLYQIALQTVSPIKLKKNGEAGHVGCALETVGGVVFTGICIDVSQLDLYNENTMVVVDFEKEVRLKELLPERWDKKWD